MRNYVVKWEDGALESLSKLDGETEEKIKDQTEKALSVNVEPTALISLINLTVPIYEIIETIYRIPQKLL